MAVAEGDAGYQAGPPAPAQHQEGGRRRQRSLPRARLRRRPWRRPAPPRPPRGRCSRTGRRPALSRWPSPWRRTSRRRLRRPSPTRCRKRPSAVPGARWRRRDSGARDGEQAAPAPAALAEPAPVSHAASPRWPRLRRGTHAPRGEGRARAGGRAGHRGAGGCDSGPRAPSRQWPAQTPLMHRRQRWRLRPRSGPHEPGAPRRPKRAEATQAEAVDVTPPAVSGRGDTAASEMIEDATAAPAPVTPEEPVACSGPGGAPPPPAAWRRPRRRSGRRGRSGGGDGSAGRGWPGGQGGRRHAGSGAPMARPLFPEDPGVDEAEVAEADSTYGFPRAEGARSESGVSERGTDDGARTGKRRRRRQGGQGGAAPGAAFQGQGGAPGAPPRQGPGRPFGAPGGGQQGRRPGGAGGGQWRDRRPEGDWRGGSGARGGAPTAGPGGPGSGRPGLGRRTAQPGRLRSWPRRQGYSGGGSGGGGGGYDRESQGGRRAGGAGRAGRAGTAATSVIAGATAASANSYDRSEPERGNERGGYRSEYDSSGPRPTSGFRALGKSPQGPAAHAGAGPLEQPRPALRWGRGRRWWWLRQPLRWRGLRQRGLPFPGPHLLARWRGISGRECQPQPPGLGRPPPGAGRQHRWQQRQPPQRGLGL